MGDYRSKSFADGGRKQMESYNGHGPNSNPPRDFRSYSASYAPSSYEPPPTQMESHYGHGLNSNPPRDFRSYSVAYAPTYEPAMTQMDFGKDLKMKRAKSTAGSSSKAWGLGDPEFKRKQRVVSYKVYTVEGKVKGSLRKSFKWLKDRYTRVVYGWS